MSAHAHAAPLERGSLNIVVLMGGPSAEHAISLKSGQGITDALRTRGWTVDPLVIPDAVSTEAACQFTMRALQQRQPDVAFIALHGAFGEDGTVQRLCDALHVAYTGSDAAASRLGMDKLASRRRFEQAGLAVPRWQALAFGTDRAPSLDGWSYPLVIKPSNQGSSLGVSIVLRPDEFDEALEAAGRYSSQVLIEEFVAGRELTVGVLGEEPLPIVEICPRHPFFDFAAKYTPGSTDYLVPAPLPPELTQRVQALGRAAHHALGCRHFSRADVILSDGGTPVLLEVNTIPGFTPTSLLPKAAACAGLAYDELCERLVLMACASAKRVGGGAWQDAARTAPIHA